MNSDPQIKRLERELETVNAKLQALKNFMVAMRSHEGDVFSWLANQELQGGYPGKELGLTVGSQGQVWFCDAEE